MRRRTLHRLLEASAGAYGERIAVVEPDIASISYAELNRLADEIARFLRRKGVCPGDRVGVHLRKSIPALASIFGILKADGAYVPVDTAAPATRNLLIFTNCAVKFVITQRPPDLDSSNPAPDSLGEIDALLKGHFIVPGPAEAVAETADDAVPAGLAYILYTSGSTGQPKGVMLTHENALAFIDWCSGIFLPTEQDRFSSHAPFHFDLSILDIYLSIKHGARLILIAEGVGRQPKLLASLIASERISIWYSTPSILKLLLDVRDIGAYDYSSLRTVLFAGEVFPIKHLRALQKLWPERRYYNLYGPTETNVCTFYEVPAQLAPDRSEPVPIGAVCSGDVARVTDDRGQDVPRGSEGELCVAGRSVTFGYWNLPERNEVAFRKDANGVRWYKTGDIVREDEQGNYLYIGRRDRMIKRRGYRVELGEIEAVLYRHDSISEAAVVASPDRENGVCVKAFINWTANKPPSIIELKRFCIENLPAYMVPDRFSVQPSLPKTSTGKIHYQMLQEMD